MLHYPGHFIMGVAALAATLMVQSYTVNQQVKRKLRLSVALLGAYVLVHIVLLVTGTSDRFQISDDDLRAAERLALAAALINLLVITAINPLRADRIPDRFPTIVQDFLVIGLVLLASTFLSDKLIATSAVGAVVIGFALQDTLGNAFAGLALQSEKPFHVGHWIRVGDFEGRVVEVTWRATKLRTRTGNFAIVPNNIIAKEAITNFSQPASPTRTQVDVGAAYESTPAAVKAAMLEALSNAPRVLKAPAPEVMLLSFDSSSITYRAFFWIDDFERDETARDQVATAIYYAFARRGIEIPYPIQVEYPRNETRPDADAVQAGHRQVLHGVDFFSSLTPEQLADVESGTQVRVFGDGEAVVREGEPGQSMFVVASGEVAVVVGTERREVARIERGGYFGEMSLLTGEPRTATVIARGEAIVLEIDADQFRRLGATNPECVEQVALGAVARRTVLNEARHATTNAAVVDAPATFVARMRKFLGFGQR